MYAKCVGKQIFIFFTKVDFTDEDTLFTGIRQQSMKTKIQQAFMCRSKAVNFDFAFGGLCYRNDPGGKTPCQE